MRTAFVFAAALMFACVAGRITAQEVPASPPAAGAATPLPAAPVRLALISGVRHQTALDAVALAEVQLSARPALMLLERSAIDKVLQEHHLVFQGLADAIAYCRTLQYLPRRRACSRT